MIVKKGFDNITVRISAISSQMRSWILAHMDECEVISPRRFREEIQRTIMDAYRKYCM